MNDVFKFINDSRQAFIKFLDGLTIEQLNHMPEGYNNNIIWHFGHVVVSTKALCYLRTGILKQPSDILFYEFYKSGTRQAYRVRGNEFQKLKSLANRKYQRNKE
ncbi:DinB family protein [Pedobacter jamesrossensis]|uniref:DinB family protein n=1 Tax=Pedobacter jamesrossensis TaxID=1908238 RepID=A0ABV8NI06_9SPHI